MGIIQSAINQALGTVSSIGKEIKSGQKNVDLQKKKAYAAQLDTEAKKELKEEQGRQTEEFQKKFIEGINAIKGVGRVTAFGANTGLPSVNMETVYTPREEDIK